MSVSKKLVEGRYMNFLSILWDICNTESETYIMCTEEQMGLPIVKYNPSPTILLIH